MADLGSDFAGVDDIDANLTEADGETAYVQAIARRYLDSGIFYAEEYGKSVAALLNAGIAPARERAALEAQALADERTHTAAVSFDLDDDGNLEIRVELTSAVGPYTLTVDPKNLTVEILAG